MKHFMSIAFFVAIGALCCVICAEVAEAIGFTITTNPSASVVVTVSVNGQTTTVKGHLVNVVYGTVSGQKTVTMTVTVAP